MSPFLMASSGLAGTAPFFTTTTTATTTITHHHPYYRYYHPHPQQYHHQHHRCNYITVFTTIAIPLLQQLNTIASPSFPPHLPIYLFHSYQHHYQFLTNYHHHYHISPRNPLTTYTASHHHHRHHRHCHHHHPSHNH
ncbi:hypothetical protein E2C01_076452 [Portunus trituberculatus]|uniref:Uncharacterized protein n=1 Tax=Portunus trituberculatus TaxID=210409 RepID=A0A5B7IJT5_PORTR|nr:hypothetical protein [Portunus trituberculatus]